MHVIELCTDTRRSLSGLRQAQVWLTTAIARGTQSIALSNALSPPPAPQPRPILLFLCYGTRGCAPAREREASAAERLALGSVVKRTGTSSVFPASFHLELVNRALLHKNRIPEHLDDELLSAVGGQRASAQFQQPKRPHQERRSAPFWLLIVQRQNELLCSRVAARQTMGRRLYQAQEKPLQAML